jgi:hypothetical protein
MAPIHTYGAARMESDGLSSGHPDAQTDSEEKEAVEFEDSDSEDDADTGSLVTMFQSRMQFHDELIVASGNRTISDDRAEALLNGLTADADDDVVITFREGKRDKYDDSAVSVDIALFYVPGADLAEVNIAENRGISRQEASQKTAMWRVLTAGNMLRELEVRRDLTIKKVSFLSIIIPQLNPFVRSYIVPSRMLHFQKPNVHQLFAKFAFLVQFLKVLTEFEKDDKTASVIAMHRANRGRNPAQVITDAKNALTPTEDKDKVVNIDSKKVKLLNEFSERKVYDLVCTCIEIDAKSLVDLIFNFRKLCSAQGKFAKLTSDDTVRILETMIEDARRLLVRSPILTRVAQRVTIQKSQNTRYGFDTGTMFHTFTTSKGIREVIQQGVGYYSSLQGTRDAQGKIGPKFMQMVVFLLSLLNDEDLGILRPILEQSYQLKADRKSIEMAVLKVLTYYAVGPHLFLTGVISAFEMKNVSIKDNEEQESAVWDCFLTDAARLGWLLPGTPEDLGRKTGSWKVSWNKFRDSDIFDHIQYCGEKDAINYIPPLKIHSEEYNNQEVSAEFRNGETYSLAAKHLDNITLAIEGNYMVTHAKTKLQRDLVVKENGLFKDLDKAAADLEHICTTVNEQLPSFDATPERPRRGGVLNRRINSIARATPFRPRTAARPVFTVKRPAGRRTKSTSTITSDGKEEIVAISWKLEGRKITYKELLKGVGTDLNFLFSTCDNLKRFADRQNEISTSQGNESQRRIAENLLHNIEIVQQRLKSCEGLRQKMMDKKMDKDDEPILRVHFPGVVHSKQDQPWAKYSQGYSAGTSQLVVKSERYVVEEDPIWVANVARVKLGEIQISVMPLKEVSEEDQAEEITKGDTLLLLGGLVAVVESPEDGGDEVVNFLKLTALDRAKARRRRGGNKEGPVPLLESVLV